MGFFKCLFQGRINRRNYILGLFFDLIFFAIAIMYAANFMTAFVGIFIEACLLVISFGFYFSIYFRRLHDFATKDNEAQQYYLAARLGIIFALIDRGNPKANQYGTPPKPTIDIKNLFGFS